MGLWPSEMIALLLKTSCSLLALENKYESGFFKCCQCGGVPWGKWWCRGSKRLSGLQNVHVRLHLHFFLQMHTYTKSDALYDSGLCCLLPRWHYFPSPTLFQWHRKTNAAPSLCPLSPTEDKHSTLLFFLPPPPFFVPHCVFHLHFPAQLLRKHVHQRALITTSVLMPSCSFHWKLLLLQILCTPLHSLLPPSILFLSASLPGNPPPLPLSISCSFFSLHLPSLNSSLFPPVFSVLCHLLKTNRRFAYQHVSVIIFKFKSPHGGVAHKFGATLAFLFFPSVIRSGFSLASWTEIGWTDGRACGCLWGSSLETSL